MCVGGWRWGFEPRTSICLTEQAAQLNASLSLTKGNSMQKKSQIATSASPVQPPTHLPAEITQCSGMFVGKEILSVGEN